MGTSTQSPPEIAEETGKPGTNFRQVGPGEKKRLSPLMRHYGKMAHPFTACVRDNRKRFPAPGQAERVCAVLKDLIKGTTKWRNQEHAMGALLEAADGNLDALEEMYRADLGGRLDFVIEQIGWEGLALLLMEARVVESALSSQARKALSSGSFVFPKDRRYPIHDLAHARNALARSSGKPEEAQVRAAVYRKFPQLKDRAQEELREGIVELAALYREAPGEPTALTALIDWAGEAPFRLSEGESLQEAVSRLRSGMRRRSATSYRREIARVGAGHETGGQFSKRPVAAIGRALAKGLSIDPGSADRLEARQAKREQKTLARRRAAPTQAKQDRAQARMASRMRRRSPVATRGEGTPPTPSAFAPGGRGEKIGRDLNEAEHKVVEAVRASPAFKAAEAEMARVGAVERLKGENIKTVSNNGTQIIYGGTPGQEQRIYDDKIRAALHAEILKAFTQGTAQSKDHTPDVLFMAGGGASGKSTMLATGQITEPESAALVNSDAIKACLPEYDALRLDPDDEIAKMAAGAVHEESSDINKRMMRYARLAKANHVVDGTGDSKVGKFRKTLDDARAAGGNVRIAYATTFVEDAVGRAEARFHGKSRRYVDTDVLYAAHAGAAANFVDVWKNTDYPVEVYDTSTKTPTLIASRKPGTGKGKMTVHDQEAFDRFIARSRGERDRAPASALYGRDLLQAVESGRVKLAELSQSQIKELEQLRRKARGGT